MLFRSVEPGRVYDRSESGKSCWAWSIECMIRFGTARWDKSQAVFHAAFRHFQKQQKFSTGSPRSNDDLGPVLFVFDVSGPRSAVLKRK